MIILTWKIWNIHNFMNIDYLIEAFLVYNVNDTITYVVIVWRWSVNIWSHFLYFKYFGYTLQDWIRSLRIRDSLYKYHSKAYCYNILWPRPSGRLTTFSVHINMNYYTYSAVIGRVLNFISCLLESNKKPWY